MELPLHDLNFMGGESKRIAKKKNNSDFLMARESQGREKDIPT